MSTALQIALFVTCVAVVLFLLSLIPLSILLYRCASRVARQLEEVKPDLMKLIQDSRAIVENVHLLSSRANQQLDEVGKVVRFVRGWSERIDHAVEEVTTLVETPAAKIARSIRMLHKTWRLIVSALVEDSGRSDHRASEIRDTNSTRK
jgi:uncharacterized protein YoxC